jgi:septal ring factor EnvC (AmiA/AmiB activator)
MAAEAEEKRRQLKQLEKDIVVLKARIPVQQSFADDLERQNQQLTDKIKRAEEDRAKIQEQFEVKKNGLNQVRISFV